MLGNLCTSHEHQERRVRTAPHPPFGHLLPQGEGSPDYIPLPPGEGGAKRRVRGRDLCRGSLVVRKAAISTILGIGTTPFSTRFGASRPPTSSSLTSNAPTLSHRERAG